MIPLMKKLRGMFCSKRDRKQAAKWALDLLDSGEFKPAKGGYWGVPSENEGCVLTALYMGYTKTRLLPIEVKEKMVPQVEYMFLPFSLNQLADMECFYEGYDKHGRAHFAKYSNLPYDVIKTYTKATSRKQRMRAVLTKVAETGTFNFNDLNLN